MKHALTEKTRKTVRGILTTIRTRHNCTLAEAEVLFQRALSGHSDAIAPLFETIDDDVAEQKEDAKQYKEYMKTR